jgi:DNA-directed RNA polymerase specialized sigma24 family protein
VLEKIYARYHDDLFDFLVHVVGDPKMAAHLFQDLLTRIESALGNPVPAPYNLTTLLYAWARESALAYLQQQGWLNALPPGANPPLAPGVTQDIWNAAREMDGVHRAALTLTTQSALRPDQLPLVLGYDNAAFARMLQDAQTNLAQRFDRNARAANRPTSAQIAAQPERFRLRKRHALAGGLFAFLPIATIPAALDASIRAQFGFGGAQTPAPGAAGQAVAMSAKGGGGVLKAVAIVLAIFVPLAAVGGGVWVVTHLATPPPLRPGAVFNPLRGRTVEVYSTLDNPAPTFFIPVQNAGSEALELRGGGFVNVSGPSASLERASLKSDGGLGLVDAQATPEVFRLLTPFPIRIPAGGTENITAVFAPDREGTYRASLEIFTNDPQANPFVFEVQGTRRPGENPPPTTVPAPLMPDLVVERLEVTGRPTYDQQENLRVPIRVVVRNVGGAAAEIFKVSVEITPDRTLIPFTVDGQRDSWYPYTREPLGGGSSVVFEGFVTIAGRYKGQAIRLQATADSCRGDEFMPDYCRVRESREDNNTLEPVPVTLP